MKTRILNSTEIREAAAIIKAGGLVAFPTETVYGLGANALDKKAVRKIFEAKKRPNWDPLIVHVSTIEMMIQVVEEVPEIVHKLMKHFIPGPLTLLLDKSEKIPSEVTANLKKVAVRMPNHEVALELITTSAVPIAAPSANLFGRPSPTTAEHVLNDLDGRIDAIIDGGPTLVGVESTVLDVTASPPVILRPGGISKEQIEQVLTQSILLRSNKLQEFASPGMSLQHYSPKARVVLVTSELELRAQLQNHKNKKIGIMLPTGWLSEFPLDMWEQRERGSLEYFHWGDWGNMEELASRLFLGLRELDSKGVKAIIAPLPSTDGLGLALRDRLEKAAA